MSEPGLRGVVPFRFACHRCGNCCSGGSGYVWVEEHEVERLARRLGVTREAFEREHLRLVPDPVSGALRRSLREESAGSDSGGRCRLLVGTNECSVYEDRPEHCRRFPYWERVLSDAGAFEAASAVCPGIVREPSPAARAAAFAALEELYAEVDALVERSHSVCIRRGVCCRFEDAGHELWATTLETDYAAHRNPTAPEPEAPGRCAYHVAGRCTAREGRPLGCRTYFCDTRTTAVLEEAHEHFLRRIREIAREHGYPAGYTRFPAALLERVEVRAAP